MLSATGAVAYYALDRAENYNSLYRETSDQGDYRGPYAFICTVEFEEANGQYEQDTEDGIIEREYDGIMSVDVLTWNTDVNAADADPEQGFSAPHEGDVVGFHTTTSKPWWFEVLKVEENGNYGPTNVFTDWKLTLKRRKSFDPERRVT